MIRIAIVVLTNCVGLAAQSEVLVPKGNHDREGHSAVLLPFNDRNMIMQQLMPPGEVGIASGASISRITFLRECNFGAGTAAAPAELVVPDVTLDRVEIRLGQPNLSTLSTTVPNNLNWGGTIPAASFAADQVVLRGYRSPAAHGSGGAAAVNFQLSPPFVYDESLPLLLEVRNLARAQTNSSTGYLNDRSTATSFAALRGWGCPDNAGNVPGYQQFTGFYVPGATTTGQVANASGSVTAWAWWLGFQYGTVLGQSPGLSLSTLLPGAGPHCRIWVDPALVTPGAGNRFPQVFTIPIPNQSSILGTPLGTQTLFVDGNAPGGVNVGPGVYAFVQGARPTNACQVALYAGAGDLSATNPSQVALDSIPLQAYAVTVRLGL